MENRERVNPASNLQNSEAAKRPPRYFDRFKSPSPLAGEGRGEGVGSVPQSIAATTRPTMLPAFN